MEEKPNYYAVIPANVRYDNELRANEKLLYGEITALAQKTGECWASNKYFSELYGVQPNAIATWLRHLKEKEYIVIKYEYQGKEIQKRMISIGIIQKDTTWYSKEYEGGIQKDSTGGIQKGEENNTRNINNTSINNKYTCEFEDLWKAYPKKVGKKDALRHYIRARKSGVSYEDISTGLNQYNEYIKNQNVLTKYIKDGSSWFNQESWNDERAIEHVETEEEWLARMEREIAENER